ncbi:uncharacterized protein LOC122934236 [Bufo gargarizans]|uniref:uncharacterized protein LOC122934236 n=2 Tax=Bufo gargarizans TaxID=30331 RepID=UPI001CF563F6|nr:uncharacterized protein LOC122934236 [Bufo gargarizans]
MPSCVIQQCSSRTVKKKIGDDVILHCFPKQKDSIKLWLQQIPQDFLDIDQLAQKILEENKNNKYRLCSLHFTEDSYKITHHGRVLYPNAIPTIFSFEKGDILLSENLQLARPSKRKRCLQSKTGNPEEDLTGQIRSDASLEISSVRTMDVATQTELSLLNSVILPKSDFESVSPRKYIEVGSERNIHSISTPNPGKQRDESESPLKKRQNRMSFNQDFVPQMDEDFSSCFTPLSPIAEDCIEDEDNDKEDSEDGQDNSDYVPNVSSFFESELEELAPIIYQDTVIKAPELTVQDEKEQVNQRKLLVFESHLENLIYKVRCQGQPNCNYLVQNFKKTFDGSYCKYTGKCYAGHYFEIFETQPRVGKYASGNIQLAASLLLSGSNFQKINEFFNLLYVVSISEKTYYRYQTNFIFPSIDKAWKQNQQSNLDARKTKKLSISGDGQCDSPGHSAKYCVYTMMDCVTDTILDFEVVQRSQCSSSVAMEKHGFGIVMDRLLEKGMEIQIFASDRHVGIRKMMKTNYPQINHQFDIWHYSKSIKKKLTKVSKMKLCKQIAPWIDKIGLHFWWCVKTSQNNVDLFKEKWFSLLHHICNQHQWEANLYSKCAHKTIEDGDEEKRYLWIIKDTPPFTNIEKIVTSQQFQNDMPHLIHGCHTGALENFHSLALKYRTKRIHFGMDGMEARTKLAVLTHNNNTGRKQATVKFSRSNTEAVGARRTKLFVPKGRSRWIVRNVYEKLSVEFMYDIIDDVLKMAGGKISHDWESRTASLPPNIANMERPNKAEIRRMQINRFRYSEK